MRFNVLGPLEVVSDGDVLTLPAGRAQAVLAMLVLHGNRAVSMERLIEAAWGGDGSATARTQIQGYISSLRRTLASRLPGAAAEANGAGTGDRLVTRASGYVLLVSEGESDVETFHAHVVKAREARSCGDQVKAIELFTEALSLWRGRAFDGISSPVLEAEADLLGQARLAAFEECAKAELDLGRHGEVMVRLAGLTETNPLHEGLHELLMLALYRSGRRAEALAAYHHLRRTLLDELGVEPAQRLRGLFQRMLDEDPGLLPPEPPEPPAPRTYPEPRPAQLPADIGDFTGRERQISALAELLAGRRARGEGTALVCAITGAGGLGKTSLAVHVAHRLDARFPGGQLYVDLRGTGPAAREPADILGDILRDLGVPDALIPDGEDARSARYRSIVANRRLLIVLDNARDSAQVRPLLPGSGACRVLVTSRNRMPGLNCARLDLEVLTPAEARALFTAIVGDRAEAEADATTAVLAVCGGLPLAIRIAGARLVSRPGWSIAGFAGRLADQRRLLDELHVEDLAVRASFDVSYASLGHGAGPAEQRAGAAGAFCLLGLFPGPEISLPAAAALIGQTRAGTEAALEHLVDSSLLDSPAQNRYRMHDLLRVYAAGLATRDLSDEERADAIERLTLWYLSAVVAADKLLWPHLRRPPTPSADPGHPAPEFSTLDQALQWLDLERPGLIEVARLAESHRLDELTSLIAIFAAGYYLRRCYWLDWLSVNENGLRSARRLGERTLEARLLTSRGIALGSVHADDQAAECFTAALRLREGLDDPAGSASTRVNLGSLLKRQGRYDEAVTCLTQALEQARRAGIRSTEATALGNLGTCHDRLGNYPQALSFQEASLAICREIGNRDGESTALMNIGEVYLHSGRPDEALSCLRQALGIARSTHGRYEEALVLTNLGRATIELGQTAAARVHLNEALSIWRALDDPQVSAVETLIVSLPPPDQPPSRLGT